MTSSESDLTTTQSPPEGAPPPGKSARPRSAYVKRGMTIVGLLLVVAPWLLDSPFWTTVAVEVVIFAILGLAVNTTLGKAGFMDLGPAIYFGIGGYTIALMWQAEQSLVLGVIVAVVLCFVAAGIIGALALRATGVYLGIVLLAFAESMRAGADRNIFGLTGGENGKLITGLPTFLNVNIQPVTMYMTALAALAVVLVVIRVLDNSMLGWTWTGIRNNVVRVQSSGINYRRQGAMAFAISGAFGGLAGVLYAMSLQIASPEMFGIAILVQVLLIVIIGGPGSYWGPVFGAIFVRVLPALLETIERTGIADPLPDFLHRAVTSHLLILGIIYILVVMYMPGGFAQLRFQAIRNLFTRNGDTNAS